MSEELWENGELNLERFFRKHENAIRSKAMVLFELIVAKDKPGAKVSWEDFLVAAAAIGFAIKGFEKISHCESGELLMMLIEAGNRANFREADLPPDHPARQKPTKH